jgi:hypothetical protein
MARGVPGGTRLCSLAKQHPVATPFFCALIVRVLAAVVIWNSDGYLFPDESQYVALGRLAASGHLTPSFQSGYGETLFHTAASFMWPLTFLFKLFGAHPVVAALWAAVFGAVTAALTALLVNRVLGRSWAALTGLAVAFFPSQILWSSVVLRESMVWAGLAGAALGVAVLSRSRQWGPFAAATVLTGVSLLALSCLRSWTFVAAAWAVALAVVLFRPARPAPARAVCALLCLLVPVLPGLGLAGSTYVGNKSGFLGYERAVLSVGAKSAFVHPEVVPATPSKPRRNSSKPSSHATTTVPTVPSALAGESLVVQKGLGNDLRALPTGLAAFALRPFPWQHGAGLSYDFASVEELVYYPLYLLAIVGVVAYRRRPDVIAFPLLVTVFVTGIAAEAEGNLGSAFRHRDQLFWAIAFFAALGAHHLSVAWRRRRATAIELQEPTEEHLTAHASL